MQISTISRAGCLAYVYDWRREATNLRGLASRSCLPDDQRGTLLREADAADRQADSWLDATIAYQQRSDANK